MQTRSIAIALLSLCAAAPAWAQNLLVNATFNTDLSGWTFSTDTDGTGIWDGTDGSPSPGSAKLSSSAPGTTSM